MLSGSCSANPVSESWRSKNRGHGGHVFRARSAEFVLAKILVPSFTTRAAARAWRKDFVRRRVHGRVGAKLVPKKKLQASTPRSSQPAKVLPLRINSAVYFGFSACENLSRANVLA